MKCTCNKIVITFYREYFEDIDRTWETFEKALWGHICNFFQLAKDRYASIMVLLSLGCPYLVLLLMCSNKWMHIQQF